MIIYNILRPAPNADTVYCGRRNPWQTWTEKEYRIAMRQIGRAGSRACDNCVRKMEAEKTRPWLDRLSPPSAP